jgi:hypothetical protein
LRLAEDFGLAPVTFFHKNASGEKPKIRDGHK